MLFEIIIGIISAAIPLSITFVLASIGEMFNQRAGVYNLGAEGIMMVGAFWGFLGGVCDAEWAWELHSPFSMLAAVAVGAVIIVLALSGRSNTMAPAVLGRPY